MKPPMLSALDDAHLVRTSAAYRGMMIGLVLSLVLTLLTILDFRRGFLFAAYPVRSVFYAFNPAHVPLLGMGLAGIFACYQGINHLEARVSGTSRHMKALTLTIFSLLVVDLLAYRAVPAARSIASGHISVDWLNAFGVTAWWKPIAQATSYLLNVWHATMLGILISGLALTTLPLYFKRHFMRSGLAGSLLGALFALPHPFCSCCSAVMAPAYVRNGATTTFLLAFVTGAPMLNITTIVLALALLPVRFAILRIVAGIIVTVLVTFLVAHIAERWGASGLGTRPPEQGSPWMRRMGDAYLRLFNLATITDHGRLETPSQLFGAWLYSSGRIALVLVPALWMWSVVASGLFQALPSAFGNNLPSVVLASIGGTLFMISTWSEIGIALQLIQSGLDGPAADASGGPTCDESAEHDAARRVVATIRIGRVAISVGDHRRDRRWSPVSVTCACHRYFGQQGRVSDRLSEPVVSSADDRSVQPVRTQRRRNSR